MNNHLYNEALELIKQGARVTCGIDRDYLIDVNEKSFILDNRITTKLRQDGWLKFDSHQGCCVLGDGIPTDYMKTKSVKVEISEDNADRGYGEGRRMGD